MSNKILTPLLYCFLFPVYLCAASAADPAEENKETLVRGGIQRLMVSVEDMEASLAFYRDWAGLHVIADLEVPRDVITRLWGLPGKATAHTVVLQNGDQPTLLELIEFQPRSGKPIREKAGLKDFGLYDLTFMVEDTEILYRDLKKKGFAFAAHNIQYPPGLFPFDVKESILIGPDAVPITHMQMLGPEKISISGNYSGIKASTQIVESTQEAIRFYRDVLGMKLRSEVDLPKGLFDESFSLPLRTEAKMAFFNQDGSRFAMLATLELSAKGESLSEQSVTSNIGLFMIALETENMSVLLNRLKEHAVKVLSGPVVRDLAPYGKISVVNVEGPSGIRLELFERLK